MEKKFNRVANFNVSVREIDGRVVFLRKLERGGSAHSFGIHVAKLAGLPQQIIRKADRMLHVLERNAAKPDAMADDGVQLSIFQLDDPLLQQIREALLEVNIDNLTPLQALEKLHDLQSLLKGK